MKRFCDNFINLISVMTILSFSLIFSLTAICQEIERNPKEVYFEIGEGDYIKEWLVIGPFPKEMETDFLQVPAGLSGIPLHGRGEARIRPYEDMAVTAPDGKNYRWKRYQSQSDIIDLLDAIGKHENVMAYAACNFLSHKDKQFELLISSDNGGKVWLNEELIHANPIGRGLMLDEDRVPVTLKRSINRCLVKVDQNIGEWGFALRFIDYQGYLQSLELELSVRRRKPDEFEDVLSITARLLPKSTVWTLPPLQVEIEIRDEAKKLLATLTSRAEETVDWMVPDYVHGAIKIIVKHTDVLGKAHEAEFTCQAHSTVPITPKVGHWETYGVTDGLSSPIIWSIVQDNNSFLWFGTGSGLCRYDGRTFQTFTGLDGLLRNTIHTIFEDGKGNLWFGGTGVCRYDGVTFQTFTTKNGLVDESVTAIYEDDEGHLWFGTANGLSEFDGKTFRNYTMENGLASNRIGDITQDKDGVFWFAHGTKGYVLPGVGATRYDRSSFTILTTQHGLVHNDVKVIMTDAQGNVWCGTSGGVSKLSVAKFRESGYDGKFFQNFTTAEGLVNNIVESILQTPSGDVWFATKGGVSRYKDGKFQNFTTKDGLAYSSLLCIAVDREGNLWFGTLSGGASRYDESVKSIPVALHYRRTAKDKQGNLWLSISGIGLGRYDGRILRTFAEEDGLTLDIIGGTFGWEISGWVGTPMVLRDMTAMNFRYLLTKMVC